MESGYKPQSYRGQNNHNTQGGGPRCKHCRRHVRTCHFSPCEAKLAEKKSELMTKGKNEGSWRTKPSASSSDQNKEDDLFLESFQGLSLSDASNLLRIPPVASHLESYLARKTYIVQLKRYTPLGLVVSFPSSRIPGVQSEEIPALLTWQSFPPIIRDMEPKLRIEYLSSRLPTGSTFNCYLNSIDEGRPLLTLALHPTPVLNFQSDVSRAKKDLPWKYLIVVDLEATCDFAPQPCVTMGTSEIIEFPYVVLDVSDLKTIASKQVYVKPDDMNGITPYCRVLTSITEDLVKDGSSLRDTVAEFDAFLQTFEPGSYILVTDGIWDLSCQLREEAKRKQIPLGPWASRYLNVKEEFRRFLPLPFNAREPSLQTMLNALKLDFVGKHHCGIDDCHSIAQIVKTLIVHGHEFKPLEIPENYDFNADPSYLGFASQAPPDSWRCETCSAKFGDPGVDASQSRSVWNKPLSTTCRFCQSPRPISDFNATEPRKCYECGGMFQLTEDEIAFYTKRRWNLPRNCNPCRGIR
eukprot:TRINITY_DN6783_c0_g1_i1.p1 TRINITY_DN6783_c0_g1~~TRINITY_DN6783_c0_g1_i1.p1  ORF type:complete len:523 (+),score=111.47 TRINITY_DN6783_c0_g1_i1:12-1580(+)